MLFSSKKSSVITKMDGLRHIYIFTQNGNHYRNTYDYNLPGK